MEDDIFIIFIHQALMECLLYARYWITCWYKNKTGKKRKEKGKEIPNLPLRIWQYPTILRDFFSTYALPNFPSPFLITYSCPTVFLITAPIVQLSSVSGAGPEGCLSCNCQSLWNGVCGSRGTEVDALC